MSVERILKSLVIMVACSLMTSCSDVNDCGEIKTYFLTRELKNNCSEKVIFTVEIKHYYTDDSAEGRNGKATIQKEIIRVEVNGNERVDLPDMINFTKHYTLSAKITASEYY